ncbi:MAG: S8 family peptidase [Bacteroidetes bacterium]|nr:S8 family peptidase [Bacteroidota bacterium]
MFFISAFSAYGQAFPGQLISRWKPGTQPETLKERNPYLFVSLRWADKDAGLLHSAWDTTRYSAEQAMAAMRRMYGCEAVQQVHSVHRRREANDPLAGSQGYLSRIQARDAWNFGTGGVTAMGDTVVVAVVDDGVDTLHPDLLPNMWVNRGEIPHNGLDDDGNGYTDDVRGWNGGDSNNRTFTVQSMDAHGTAISGIIGARGNNNTGIAGVNWQVKIMPVLCYASSGSGSDIGVVRSLLYVYRMKKLYLSSMGTKGANVVAVNTSVGIDRATPQDAPLWCALYDSLGSVGIMSAAATSNTNINVATEGDIPSTCPARSMLVVSSTDINDQRVSCGFSDSLVDLAAPGENALSAELVSRPGTNGPYKAVSGTSFAAPQVAGALALLTSQSCKVYLGLLKSKPDSAIQLMTGWIMQGTDKLNSLTGKTKSGGRLNINKAWLQMDAWCKNNDIPYAVTEVNPRLCQVFPNPAAAGSNLKVSALNNGISKVSIYSVSGQLLAVESVSAQNGTGFLSLPALQPGLLILQIEDGDSIRRVKLYTF